MSTPAAIGMKMGDGTVHAVRVNWDGYLSGVGNVLNEHYRSYEIVKDLLWLGELSSLNDSPDTTVAYHRDYNEKMTPPMVFNNTDEFLKNGKTRLAAEYLYYYDPDEDKWYVTGMPGIRFKLGWNELETLVNLG